MKKISKYKKIFIVFTVLILNGFFVLNVRAEEKILDFNSDIQIQKNSDILVTEIIKVQSEAGAIRHGIYRDFPTIYQDDHGLRTKIDFKVLSVKRDGIDEPFSIASVSNGKRIYIGDVQKLIPAGQHEYTLSYQVNKELGFFPDHDELYWNVTGNGWQFPIELARATVTLPAGANIGTVTYAAYTGVQGSKATDYVASATTTASAVQVVFNSTNVLLKEQGLTIVVGWPKGLVIAPTPTEKYQNFLLDNLGAIVATLGLLFLFIYYFVVWLAVGRDPKKKAIIPLYEPPKGMTPSATRFMMSGCIISGIDNKSLAASILYLAVNGYLKIEKKLDSFHLTKTGDKVPTEGTEEKIVLDALLSDEKSLRLGAVPETSSKIIFAIKDLGILLNRDYGNYKVSNWKFYLPEFGISLAIIIGSVALMAPEIRVAIFAMAWLSIWTIAVSVMLSVIIKGWSDIIKGNGGWVGTIFITLFSIPFIFAEIAAIFFFTGMGVASLIIIVDTLLIVLVNIIFASLLENVTVSGQRLREQIEGFKWFLSVTEKDRLNFSHPPELTPRLFEKFLPYALALGVENKWAEQFADVFAEQGDNYHPLWYGGSLNSVSDLTCFTHSFTTSVSSSGVAPGSSSGFSSGGSSGGGGGGGGGGGW